MSTSTARPSILIVGYKAYDELEGCLASIARHEPGASVVVVDHDADAARGRAIQSAHPTIVYVPTPGNPGFGAGVNRAARASAAGPLLLLNPDCELTGPILEPLARVLAEHPRAGIVGGLVREADGGVQASARAFPDWTTGLAGRTSWLTRVLPGNPLTRRNLKMAAGESSRSAGPPVVVDWVSGAFMLIRREAFDAIGGFDEGFFLYWEDADLCRRAKDTGWTTIYAPVATVTHHTSRASRHAPVRSLVAFHVSALRYHWKHGGWLARLLSPMVAAALATRLAVRVLRR